MRFPTSSLFPTALAEVDTADLHVVVGGMPCTSWCPAELAGTVQYLRGCKDLVLPPELRPVFPQNMDGFHDMVSSKMGG